MQIETRRFGTIDVGEDEMFDLPHGIPGFAQMRRVALLATASTDADSDSDSGIDGEPHSLFWMQDLDDGRLAFLCVIPWSLFPGYDVEFDESEIGLGGDTDVRVLNLVTVHRSAGSPPAMTVNLRAPLLVDVRGRRMQQIILADGRWPISAPMDEPIRTGAH